MEWTSIYQQWCGLRKTRCARSDLFAGRSEIIFLKDIFYVHFMLRFILESTSVTAGPDSVASTTQFLCFEFVLPKALIFVLLKKYGSTFIRIYDDIIYMCSFCRVQDSFWKMCHVFRKINLTHVASVEKIWHKFCETWKAWPQRQTFDITWAHLRMSTTPRDAGLRPPV